MGWYYDIYNIIVQYIYGGQELNSFQELITTQVATIGSMVAAAAPVIVILWVAKWVLSLIKF